MRERTGNGSCVGDIEIAKRKERMNKEIAKEWAVITKFALCIFLATVIVGSVFYVLKHMGLVV